MLRFYLRRCEILHALVLCSLALAVYSNNFKHDYPLDSGHLLLDNSAVRDLRNIPSYFRDPSTLTSLRSNIDYRPVLQITYALNYAISGYDTWSWHLVQILLHALCALGLYAFCMILMTQSQYDRATSQWTSFVIALIFTLHPAASGVVNYLSARSSLLTAAFLLPAMCLYMRSYEDPRYRKPPLLSAFLYGLALFTKVEAIGALPVFFLYDAFQACRNRMASSDFPASSRHGPLRDMLAAFNVTTLRRLRLFLLVSAFYIVIRAIVMHGYDTGARHAEDITPLIYFFTQLTAWWHYVRVWIAPVGLVADTMNYPIFRSALSGQVMLAVGGWMLVAAAVRFAYSKYPFIFFVSAASLCLIAPTSSLAPLAEMVNEHRPYLPVALFSCAWLIPLLPAAFRLFCKAGAGRAIGIAGFFMVTASLLALTWQRNKVFSNGKAYWRDILDKAPSARAYANYGLTFLSDGRWAEALDYYQQALRMAPNWHIVHINLGLIYHAMGNDSLAALHFNRAVATDQYSATAQMYRGEYFLSKRKWSEALSDFESILPLHREKYRLYKGAATAASGKGDFREAIRYCRLCRAIAPRQVEFDMVSISRPYWEMPGLCSEGINFYQSIDSLLPGRWWVHYNLGDLAKLCGNQKESAREFSIARQLKSR